MKNIKLVLLVVAVLACASSIAQAANITIKNNSGMGKYVTLLSSNKTVYLPGGATSAKFSGEKKGVKVMAGTRTYNINDGTLGQAVFANAGSSLLILGAESTWSDTPELPCTVNGPVPVVGANIPKS